MKAVSWQTQALRPMRRGISDTVPQLSYACVDGLTSRSQRASRCCDNRLQTIAPSRSLVRGAASGGDGRPGRPPHRCIFACIETWTRLRNASSSCSIAAHRASSSRCLMPMLHRFRMRHGGMARCRVSVARRRRTKTAPVSDARLRSTGSTPIPARCRPSANASPPGFEVAVLLASPTVSYTVAQVFSSRQSSTHRSSRNCVH